MKLGFLSKIKRRYVIIAIVIALIVGGYFMFFSQKSVSVKKISTTEVQITKSVSADGEVDADNKADLAFGASGKIQTINVKKFQFVQQNQLLAALDQSSFSSTIQTYRDARDIALRDRDLFLEKYKDGEARDSLGGETEYQINLRKVNEEVSRAQAAYNAQISGSKNLNIRAPFAGLIVMSEKKAGENAAIGETIFKIIDTNSLYFKAFLDQEDFGQLKTDQRVEVLLDSYEGQDALTGYVDQLPQVIEDGQNNFLIRIPFDSQDRNIAYGMTGEARIIVDQTNDKVQALSFDSLFTDENNKTYVWIVKNGKLEKHYITTGLEGDFYTEIKEDLSGLELVLPNETPKTDLTGQKANIAAK